MTIHVIYHADNDGLGAAFAVWRKYHHDNPMLFYRAQYGEEEKMMHLLNLFEPNDLLFIVDFSFKRPVCDKFAAKVETVVIDHHVTGLHELEGAPYLYYSNDYAGCTLAWKYFFEDEKIPLLLQYIEDRDLWRFKLSHSKAINKYLELMLTPEEGDNVIDLFQWMRGRMIGTELYQHNKLQRAVDVGSLLYKEMMQQVEKVVDLAAVSGSFLGYSGVPVANCPLHVSEVGNQLLKRYPEAPFAAVYFDTSDRKTVYSLRSNGEVDVSEIAKSMGGGGHRAAAGFRVSQTKRDW